MSVDRTIFTQICGQAFVFNRDVHPECMWRETPLVTSLNLRRVLKQTLIHVLGRHVLLFLINA